MPHLLATITANGFGHAVQTGAVLRALRRHRPDLRITVQTAIPADRVAEIAPAPFDLVSLDHDFGVVIRSATELDLPATEAAHARLLRDWDALAKAQTDLIRDRGVDLVLANVSFLAVEGARRAGVPAAVIACLTWSDILRGLGVALDAVPAMETAYGKATAFFQPAPSMPTSAPVRPIATGPISSRGRDRRAEMRARLGLPPDGRLVLVALGGMGDVPPVARWPEDPGLFWIVPDGTPPGPRGATLGALGLAWPDAVASVDAFVGKPGYGSVANVAVHGTPFLYMMRGDWPEEPPLVAWLHRHAQAREIARDRLWAGDLRADLDALWAQPARSRLEPTGAEEIAQALLGLLR